MGYLDLKAQDWKRINQALESSFGVPALDALVLQNFPRVHGEVPWLGVAKADLVFKVVLTANQYGLLDQLIVATAAERPDRQDLRALVLYYAQKPGWTAPVQTNGLDLTQALEKLTIPGDPFINTTRLARWMMRVERQVCQVRCGTEHGTGFLIAPDLVMTCYHVVEQHLKGQVNAAAVQVRFDYHGAVNGTEPSYDEGTWINIDATWQIPNSPYSQADLSLTGEPNPAELDFAILKLSEKVGQERVGVEQQARGWLDLSKDPPIPVQSDPILIVQHPQSLVPPPPQMPLQIAFATPGFGALNSMGTRLAYTPNTRQGSSGSPVFDGSLQVVALHHNRGQINPEAKELVKNNRGIPLGKIRAALADGARGLLAPPP